MKGVQFSSLATPPTLHKLKMAAKNNGNHIFQFLKTSHQTSFRIHKNFIEVIIQPVTLPNLKKFKIAAENQENHIV